MFQHTAPRRRLAPHPRMIHFTARFNTQPPEGGWLCVSKTALNRLLFQHTAARRRLGASVARACHSAKFQHTAARRRLVRTHGRPTARRGVSTHSRPKAAGGLERCGKGGSSVSTHSRPKAAGKLEEQAKLYRMVSTHSRPKAAGSSSTSSLNSSNPFQHTAARRRLGEVGLQHGVVSLFQHTAARRRLDANNRVRHRLCGFQHTAARRRLEIACPLQGQPRNVSTHSRPKAAGSSVHYQASHIVFQHTAARRRLGCGQCRHIRRQPFQHTAARRRLADRAANPANIVRFNTQPPEGGWADYQQQRHPAGVSTHSRPKAAGKRQSKKRRKGKFQHTAARRRLATTGAGLCNAGMFQHTAARRRLANVSTTNGVTTVCFNTQPPEGGWSLMLDSLHSPE